MFSLPFLNHNWGILPSIMTLLHSNSPWRYLLNTQFDFLEVFTKSISFWRFMSAVVCIDLPFFPWPYQCQRKVASSCLWALVTFHHHNVEKGTSFVANRRAGKTDQRFCGEKYFTFSVDGPKSREHQLRNWMNLTLIVSGPVRQASQFEVRLILSKNTCGIWGRTCPSHRIMVQKTLFLKLLEMCFPRLRVTWCSYTCIPGSLVGSVL